MRTTKGEARWRGTSQLPQLHHLEKDRKYRYLHNEQRLCLKTDIDGIIANLGKRQHSNQLKENMVLRKKLGKKMEFKGSRGLL